MNGKQGGREEHLGVGCGGWWQTAGLEGAFSALGCTPPA